MIEQIGLRREEWSEQNRPAVYRPDQQVIVLSNREPWTHEDDESGRITARRSASGVVHAVEPLIQACSGVWIAQGVGDADRRAATERDGVDVPPDAPRYRLRRIWLDEGEEQGFYYGFANEALWPLCHRVHVRPVFRADDFYLYWSVNNRFAAAVQDEAATESPIVLVQDYHLAMAPEMIRERLPLSSIVAFWHIPWPHWQTFEMCPWYHHLLEGLLGSSIVGFQTACDCRNFIETAERLLQVHVDREQSAIAYAGRRVLVRAYPTSIEWPSPGARRAASLGQCRDEVRRRLGVQPGVRLGVSVDRLDYTKGIEEKFAAVERLLECYPETRGRFVLAQLAQPTRERLASYRETRSRVADAAARVNARFGAGDYQPILLLEGHYSPDEVFRYLRAADLCYVGSLHDGMNLVSKEFVSARDDEQGVLVLSVFTGAARELTGSVTVNPYDVDEVARGLAQALTMPEEEQRVRMRHMRSHVAAFDAHRWGRQILADAIRVGRERRNDWSTAALPA